MVWTQTTKEGWEEEIGASGASSRWALMDEASFLMAWTQAIEKGGGGGWGWCEWSPLTMGALMDDASFL